MKGFDFIKLVLAIIAAVQAATFYYVQDIGAIKERLIRLETIVSIRLGVAEAPPAAIAGNVAGGSAHAGTGDSSSSIVPALSAQPIRFPKGVTP